MDNAARFSNPLFSRTGARFYIVAGLGHSDRIVVTDGAGDGTGTGTTDKGYVVSFRWDGSDTITMKVVGDVDGHTWDDGTVHTWAVDAIHPAHPTAEELEAARREIAERYAREERARLAAMAHADRVANVQRVIARRLTGKDYDRAMKLARLAGNNPSANEASLALARAERMAGVAA